MASQNELKKIALARVVSAKKLLDCSDWDGCAQMMGLALECALKSVICKTLRIQNYPESHSDKKVPDFFMHHGFVRLLLLAGLSDVFSPTSSEQSAFLNWSNFTFQYPGAWTSMRYIPGKFDEATIKNLFQWLHSDPNSIIKTINRKRRW